MSTAHLIQTAPYASLQCLLTHPEFLQSWAHSDDSAVDGLSHVVGCEKTAFQLCHCTRRTTSPLRNPQLSASSTSTAHTL